MTADLKVLLAGVEAAEGPDRELDARLYVALIARLQNPAVDSMIAERAALRPTANVWLDGARDWQVKPYTASLDAALALCERVLPACARIDLTIIPVTSGFRPCTYADVYPNEDESTGRVTGRAPALSLLAAMLKAKIAQAESAPA